MGRGHIHWIAQTVGNLDQLNRRITGQIAARLRRPAAGTTWALILGDHGRNPHAASAKEQQTHDHQQLESHVHISFLPAAESSPRELRRR
jgi:hypothetical protein